MATEDKGSVPSEEKIEMPKRKGTRKRMNSLATFFKAWATPLTILISVAGFLWGVYQFNAQQAVNQAQTLDQQQQATLDTYLDRMSDLLLTYHLSASKPGDEVRAVAQARTYTALQNLDGTRKGTLIEFLWEANLIYKQQPIISLDAAYLNTAWLVGASLGDADLSGADLDGAILSGASLSDADLRGAHLDGTWLSETDLKGVDLSYANLAGALHLTQQQLDQVSSCKNANLPPGLTCHHNQ